MSILDEYDSLERRSDKELLLREFRDIDPEQIPAAYKAWFDIMFEYLVKDISVEDKGTVLYLFDQCNFNHRIYLRDFGYNCPIVTIVEKWTHPDRLKDLMSSWIGIVLNNQTFTSKDIMNWICMITGMDDLGESQAEIKGDRWVNDYYVYILNPQIPIHASLLLNEYKSKPIQSNYHKYKQYIYQLLEMYNIKKESE